MALFGKSRYTTVRASGENHRKKEKIPQGTFEQCDGCQETVYANDFEANLSVCPHCGYHRPIPAERRIQLLTDAFVEIDAAMRSTNVLNFESYTEKLERDMAKTKINDAIVCGVGSLAGRSFALGVMDFRFLGGSMGSVVGEKFTRLAELATKERLPLVVITASGGARMHESMFSLMQMAKTSGALERHAEAGLPYIVVMTHPTTGGTTASFASLGDVIIAEPKAQICFAGPRVIKDTTQATLPDGFQTSEFLFKKGLIDRITPRKKLRQELSLLLEFFSKPCECAKSVDSIVSTK